VNVPEIWLVQEAIRRSCVAASRQTDSNSNERFTLARLNLQERYELVRRWQATILEKSV